MRKRLVAATMFNNTPRAGVLPRSHANACNSAKILREKPLGQSVRYGDVFINVLLSIRRTLWCYPCQGAFEGGSDGSVGTPTCAFCGKTASTRALGCGIFCSAQDYLNVARPTAVRHRPLSTAGGGLSWSYVSFTRSMLSPCMRSRLFIKTTGAFRTRSALCIE